MFTQFGSTAESLSKASTMVFRIGTDAHLYDDPDDVSIAPLLDSKFDSEKCEALKRLLALIAQGFDVSNYFPQVVKNVASQSLEVKKLVYLYLLHYAEKRPNEALLSINYFQKDLGDPNPLVRARALRTMAGIRLHAIAPLVLVAVQKCARDPSVYVRKCAANALPKLHDLRLEEIFTSIEEIVGILLNDNSPAVVGAAAAAFASICPDNLALIGRNFRRLCQSLPDVEEWGQVVLIGNLLRYVVARHGLAKESVMLASHYSDKYILEKEDSNSLLEVKEIKDDVGYVACDLEIADVVCRSYLEGPDKYLSRLSNTGSDFNGLDGLRSTSAKSNDDVKILLQCTLPLMWSQNSAVVLAAAGLHWIMAPKEHIYKIIKPLLFLLRSSSASKFVVLCNILVFVKVLPTLFAPYFEDFFVSASDSYQIKALKLEILSLIATDSSISYIFQEFQDYIRDPDRRFAADTVSTVGLCAQRLTKVANTCLEGLLALTSAESSNKIAASDDGEAIVLVQAVNSIKEIINQDPPSHEKVIIHLVRSLDWIRVPVARAMIVWMVGEYNNIGQIILKLLPTVVKYFAHCFAAEATDTKLQILNALIKVLLSASTEDLWTFRRVLSYVLELANCDLNYDVRDRARFLSKLLSYYIASPDLEEGKDNTEKKGLAYLLLKHIFGGQMKPSTTEPLSYRFYLPGSLSHIVLHAAPGYEPLPEPCSLVHDNGSNAVQEMESLRERTRDGSSDLDDEDDASGSLDEENASDYGFRDSSTSYTSEPIDDPLIHLSDVGNSNENQVKDLDENVASSGSDEMAELMSRRVLNSWLDENPGSGQKLSSEHRSSAQIAIGNIGSRVQPKTYTMLDPSSGGGLGVDYTFSSEVSSISPLLVCVQVSFKNCSKESMSNLLLTEEESDRSSESSGEALPVRESSSTSPIDVPTLVPMEEIIRLEPGQTTNRLLQVRFHHHLLPLKLVLLYNGKKNSVKLRPDIGYFIKPLPVDVNTFAKMESQLPGMFEYTRRCTFTDHLGELNKGDTSLTKDNFLLICESLALKMLSNANLFLVAVDMPVTTNLDDVSGLRLRFTGEILSNSFSCLITLTLEGTCSGPLNVSVKINCEETVFGLNLLNRVVNFLSDPTQI